MDSERRIDDMKHGFIRVAAATPDVNCLLYTSGAGRNDDQLPVYGGCVILKACGGPQQYAAGDHILSLIHI